MAQQFFYDGQIRRFLVQFMRILSGFQVEFGKNADGVKTLQTVPIYYGDPSRQAATILRNNSENALNGVPAMSAYINALTYEQNRMQDPTHVGKINLRQRQYDVETGTYNDQQGDSYTVERLMPVPYKLQVKLDIWTSNTEQKMQIIEQIATLFNPSFEIQATDNYIDWTSLTFVQLGDVMWSSRVVPSSAEESIDIASLTFDMPIWITSPAKVKRLGVIQKFISSVYDEQGEFSEDTLLSNLVARVKVTPLDYGIFYTGNQMKLVKPEEVVSTSGVITKVAPTKETWEALIGVYGTLVTGTTELRLELDTGNELIGQIAYHPTDPTILLFTPTEDTLPLNTLTAVAKIINPINITVDSSLTSPVTGTRYILTDHIGAEDNQNYSVWGDVVAHTNDIIQYDGTRWIVVFDSDAYTNTEYVTNTNTGVQYRWTGSEWVKSVEGLYRGGEWSLAI